MSLKLTCALALLLALAACASKPAPREATDAELAPQDTDLQGRPIAPGAATPPPRVAEQPKKPADKPAAPTADGPIVTLLYVCEIGNKLQKRPAVVIFSSDPESPYLNERPRPSRILKPLTGWKISQLLADLEKAGLPRLPAEEQPLDQRIEGDRQILIVRDGKRVDYRKNACKQDKDLYELFARCEKVLIDYSAGSDTFVETEGLAPIQGH